MDTSKLKTSVYACIPEAFSGQPNCSHITTNYAPSQCTFILKDTMLVIDNSYLCVLVKYGVVVQAYIMFPFLI